MLDAVDQQAAQSRFQYSIAYFAKWDGEGNAKDRHEERRDPKKMLYADVIYE